jgi:hypothetical protein
MHYVADGGLTDANKTALTNRFRKQVYFLMAIYAPYKISFTWDGTVSWVYGNSFTNDHVSVGSEQMLRPTTDKAVAQANFMTRYRQGGPATLNVFVVNKLGGASGVCCSFSLWFPSVLVILPRPFGRGTDGV